MTQFKMPFGTFGHDLRHSSQEGSLGISTYTLFVLSPGSSVNDFIPEECSSVHYASIIDAISVIKRKGAGCFMAKTDVKSAFRIIPIHPNDFALLGMKWQNAYYFDRCLPMGCSSS